MAISPNLIERSRASRHRIEGFLLSKECVELTSTPPIRSTEVYGQHV